ncbi:MAG: PEP-utilizing enzyme [Actinomycetota bacterium]
MGFDVRWDDPADAACSWRRAQSQPPTRLYQDVLSGYYEAARGCYERTGTPMAREHIVRWVDGWPYVRGPEADEDSAQRLAEHGRHIQGYADKGDSYYVSELRPEVVGIVERLRKHPRISAPIDVLVAHVQECIDAYAHIMGDLHWRFAGAIAASGRTPFFWPALYNEITGRPEAEAATLLGGLANEMAKTIRDMQKLARLVRADDRLRKAVESKDLSALEQDGPYFQKFGSGFRSFLRRHGVRCGHGYGSKSALETPTWRMQPEIPLGLIATYARSDLDAAERKEKDAARERKRLTNAVRRELRGDPERSARFDAALEQAKVYATRIEDHNHWMDQSAPGILREAVGLLGRRLVRDGLIDHPDDVMHLSSDELARLGRSELGRDLRQLVAERRRELDAAAARPAPGHIGAEAEGELIPERFAPTGAGLEGKVLHGIPASSGRYEGRARVVPPALEPPDLDDGDILVAIDAGPSWTPVFAVLGAVVLDRGAAFQHAAVMAREFGIPAVVGTKDATKAIADGETITVDGDAGIVAL